jgi:hypothetical protein
MLCFYFFLISIYPTSHTNLSTTPVFIGILSDVGYFAKKVIAGHHLTVMLLISKNVFKS